MPYDMLVPLEAQIACAERELKYRMFVYPKRVNERRMTSEKMAQELAGMRAILETLHQLERKERLL